MFRFSVMQMHSMSLGSIALGIAQQTAFQDYCCHKSHRRAPEDEWV